MALFPPTPCEHCNVSFIPSRRWQKYCCPEHRLEAFYKRRATNTPVDDWWTRAGLEPLSPNPIPPNIEEEITKINTQTGTSDLSTSLDDLGYGTKPESGDLK